MRGIRFPLVKPYIPQSGIAEVAKVLRSGWLTQGKYAAIVEEFLCSYNKVKYAFVVNSATSGLIAALQSLGLDKNSEVIVPSFSFPATANAVLLSGAKPVFCDIDLDTFNISVEKIEGLIHRNTKAIMPVHEFGLSASMESILPIAKKHNLYIIEDAACSLGAEYKGKKVGIMGDIGIFSFHPRKIITSGEGGCVITNSVKVAMRIECLRNHGAYNVKFIDCGYNFRMTDIQAAILFPQLEHIEQIITQRRRLARNYNALFSSLAANEILKCPSSPQGFKHIYQSYTVLLSKKIGRDKLKNILRDKGIEAQFGTYCIPMIEFYRKTFDIPKESYRNAYHAYRYSLTLPLYHDLSFREQEYIVDQFQKAVKKCAR